MSLSRSEVHIDTALSNFSVGFMSKPGKPVASDAFPMTKVTKESDFFYRFDKSHQFRDDAKPRAPGTEAAQGEMSLSNDRFNVEVYSFKGKLPWRIRDAADSQLKIDMAMTNFVTRVLRIRRERRFVERVTQTASGANWLYRRAGADANPTAGTEVLTLGGGGSIIETVADMFESIEEGTGGETGEMVLIMGTKVRRALRRNAEILDRIKFTGGNDGRPRKITDEAIADLLDVNRIIVPRDFYATSPAGTAEDSVQYSRIWPEDSMLLVSVGGPELMDPSAGKQFSYAMYDGVDAKGAAIQRYDERKIQSDWYEGEIAVDFKITNLGAGAIVTNVVDEEVEA